MKILIQDIIADIKELFQDKPYVRSNSSEQLYLMNKVFHSSFD